MFSRDKVLVQIQTASKPSQMLFTTGSQKAVLQTRWGRQSAHLQHNPRLCGWSTALHRCAGSPQSACRHGDSHTGHSLCAHISNRSRGSVKRKRKLCPCKSVKQQYLCLGKHHLTPMGSNCCSYPVASLQSELHSPLGKLCSAGILKRRHLLILASYEPADARHLDRLPQAQMEEGL